MIDRMKKAQLILVWDLFACVYVCMWGVCVRVCAFVCLYVHVS